MAASGFDVPLAQEFGFDPSDLGFKEGKQKMRLHIIKERNIDLVRSAKAHWLDRSNGNLKCTVCDFSFSDTYGELGEGFIEAHHTMPISTLSAVTIMKIADLSPVCSNCHRMLHRRQTLTTIEKLKQVVATRKAS